jgi:GT2 family glycosyltransferase
MRIKEGYTNTIKQELISIIIITYNAMAWADKCLNPLANVPDNAKVYIIDNGSSDGTQDFIKSNFKQFNFYQSKLNLGFGKANNLGFEMALKDGCSHFLLLNQDATISWNSIIKLAEIQNEHLEYGIISPVQLHNDEKVDYLHLKSLMKNSYTYFNDLVCENNLKSIYDIGYTNAAIWLISKKCLRIVGGFDPLFPHYGEDNEYAQRVNLLGLKVGLATKVKGYHFRNQVPALKSKTVNFYYNIFLIRVKDTSKNKSYQFFKIFSELIRGSAGRLLGSKGQANTKSWIAFAMVLRDINIINRNRLCPLSQSYPFLNYKE